MRIFLLVVHLLLTLVMIGVILIQRGEDANAGSSSGYGAMPGARSGKNLLTRLTSVLAGIFFANCIFIAIRVRNDSKLSVISTEKKDRESQKEKPDNPTKDGHSPGATGEVSVSKPLVPESARNGSSPKGKIPAPSAVPSSSKSLKVKSAGKK